MLIKKKYSEKYQFEEQSHYYIDTLTQEFGKKQDNGQYIIDFSDSEEEEYLEMNI